jgi:hypothetical protein
MISYICISIVSQTMSKNITPQASSVALRPPCESLGIVFNAMEEEIWKPIEDSLGMYEVSNLGNVRNSETKRHIKQTHTRQYSYVSIWYGDKRVRKTVHRLVLCAFSPNNGGNLQINHKDENPGNNRLDNLEWCTASYNASYGSRNRRMLDTRLRNGGAKMERPVFGIRGDERLYFKSISLAARETGIDFSNIAKCCRSSCYNKTAGGYKWEYANLE